MDEPFAALDSFTRQRMQAELVRVWKHERKAVLFITHNIDEAIKLGDRVVVMSARPGRIVKNIELNFPRPGTLIAPNASLSSTRCGRLFTYRQPRQQHRGATSRRA